LGLRPTKFLSLDDLDSAARRVLIVRRRYHNPASWFGFVTVGRGRIVGDCGSISNRHGVCGIDDRRRSKAHAGCQWTSIRLESSKWHVPKMTH
jgi:hypothetical protein